MLTDVMRSPPRSATRQDVVQRINAVLGTPAGARERVLVGAE